MTAAQPLPIRRKLVFLLPLALFLGLAALFLLRLFAGDASRVPSALIGRAAPMIDMPALEGLMSGQAPVPGLRAASLAEGRVTVVNVWASWCAPCRVEHPLLMDLARDRGVRMVGLNYKDQAENARRFLGALGNPFAAVGVDADGRGAIEWGVYGVPETFVVDGRGIIRHKHVGPLTPADMPALRKIIAEAAGR